MISVKLYIASALTNDSKDAVPIPCFFLERIDGVDLSTEPLLASNIF